MPELMTKQDAIEYLLYMKHDVQAKSPMDIALDTAIEELKQPTIEQVRTNGDKIRAMTDEELAEWLDRYAADCRLCDGHERGICNSECIKGHLAWLQKEVDEDD